MTRPSVDVRGRKSGMKSHLATTSGSVEWYTPPGVLEALGLRFELDPCSPAGGLPWIDVDRYFTADDDGLSQRWSGRVWMNPPYGRGIVHWMRKLAAHGDGVALVPAATDTEWWRETVPPAAWAVCMVAGRITFVDANRVPGEFNGGHASALVAYGEECAAAVMSCGMGWPVRNPNPGQLGGQPTLWEW